MATTTTSTTAAAVAAGGAGAQKLNLRLRHDKGTVTVSDFTKQSSFLELLELSAALLDTSPDNVDVKAGFPPKSINAPDNTLLGSIFTKSAELVTLAKKNKVTSLAASSPTTSNVQPKPSLSAPSSLPPQQQQQPQRQQQQQHSQQPPPKKQRSESPQPLTLTRKPRSNQSATNPPYVRLDSQYIVRLRVMEDDNSCLFRAIAYTVKRNLALVPELRKIAAAAILQKPIDYNEAILGKPPVEYSQWIQKPSSWGGAIELAVFAEHYGIEICSIDVQTLRVDRFRPTDESKVNDRVIIIYSGIHFDAIAMAQSIGDPEDFDQTVFNAGKEGDRVLDCAVKVAEEMQRRRDFTDTANFTLKCSICKAGLKGQKDAITHANETGHSSFEEY